MAVAFDAVGPSSSGTGSATSPLTWTHVCGATATEIVVGATIFNGSTNVITAVTYGGQSLTLVGFIPSDNDSAGGIALYHLTNPPTGSNTVSVSFTGGGNTNAGSISFTGSSGIGTAVTGFSNATSVSASVTNTTTGGMVTAAASYGGTQLNTFSGTNGVTVQWQHPGSGNSGSDNGVGGTVASTGGGASQTVGFSDTGTDFWGIVAVEILPATSAASPPPFLLNPPGRQSPMAFQYFANPVSYDITGQAAVNGTVQPLATRQPRRASARAYWRGFVSSTTNLLNGTVPPHPVVARRTSARAVWKGFVSSTTNLRNGNPANGVIYRRKAARAVWRGTVSSTTNLLNGNDPGGVIYRRKAARAVIYRGPAPFPPPIGTVPDHLVVARRSTARAVWKGFTSFTTNLLNGNAPGSGLVKRRAAARAVIHGNAVPPQVAKPVQDGLVARRTSARAFWRPTATRTTNLLNGNAPGGLVRRRVPARAVWAGTVSRTANATSTVSGTAPLHLVVARRAGARAVWKGFVSSTTNLLYGNAPGGLVRRRTAARAFVRGFVSSTVNQVPTVSGSAPDHLVVARRAPARAVWRGFTSVTVNATVTSGTVQPVPTVPSRRHAPARVVWRGSAVPGQQPKPETGGLVRRRPAARSLWHGNAGSPPPSATSSTAPAGPRVSGRRPPARGQWRGVTVRTTNAIPVAVKAPRQRFTAPRRTSARVAWKGTISSTSNAVAGISFSTGVMTTNWLTGSPRTNWTIP